MNPPSPQEVDQLDEQLDLVPELAGAGIGFVGGDECIVLRAPQHSSGLTTLAIRRATGKSWTAILKGLNRAERKRLAEELIRTQKPGISGGGLKTLVRAGTFPKRLRSSEITERLFIQLKDAISASLSFAGSSTSGVVKLLYVHVVQE